MFLMKFLKRVIKIKSILLPGTGRQIVLIVNRLMLVLDICLLRRPSRLLIKLLVFRVHGYWVRLLARRLTLNINGSVVRRFLIVTHTHLATGRTRLRKIMSNTLALTFLQIRQCHLVVTVVLTLLPSWRRVARLVLPLVMTRFRRRL